MDKKEKLVQLFKDRNIGFNFESDWAPFFIKNCDLIESSLLKLDKSVKYGDMVRPSFNKIFAAFNTNYKDIKVVFVGEDPYPEKENAIGYSFLYGSDKIPGSALNIKKALQNYVGSKYEISNEDFKYLFSYLGYNNFLMINSAFTIEVINKLDDNENRKARDGKHFSIWKPFFEEVVNYLEQKGDVLFVTMGNHAINCTPNVKNAVRCSHPSGLGCYQDLKSGHPAFNKINIWETIDEFVEEKFNMSIKDIVFSYLDNK